MPVQLLRNDAIPHPETPGPVDGVEHCLPDAICLSFLSCNHFPQNGWRLFFPMGAAWFFPHWFGRHR